MKTNSADLTILDMIMIPGQKAIIASGFSDTDRFKKAQALGAGKYIKKPYPLEKIGFAVKEELEK